MFKSQYNRFPFFFNMMAVLLLLTVTRILDSLAWLPPSPHKTGIVLLNYLFEYISFIPVIFILIYSYRWAVNRKRTLLLCLLIIIFAIFLPGFVLILSTWLEIIFSGKEVQQVTLNLIEKFTPGVSLVILLLSATYYLTHLIIQTARQRDSAHQAETMARDVQLKMLRYQINPHFLFNVLNSIYTLIDENRDKARKLVLDMSEYYRYTLTKQQVTISIEKEVESIVRYLEIQKTRFEDEFQFEISVDEDAKPILIPSFLIHLLIENAVKYGTKTAKQKLIVHLSAEITGDILLIKVANTGKLWIGTQDTDRNVNGTSNGIENLKHRLGLYYADNFSFSLKEEDGWVIAAIEIKDFTAG